jgi:hypothetical protein
MHRSHGQRNSAGRGSANGQKNQIGVNLVHTKFFFMTLGQDDEPTRTKVRAAGAAIGRGFLNDFDADGGRDPMLETIQFLVSDEPRECDQGIGSAQLVAQVSAKYRPRLQDVETEFRRRLGDSVRVRTLDGAIRVPRYTSAELHERAYAKAVCRQTGAATPNAIIFPMNKSAEWWGMQALERHQYFYPHTTPHGHRVKGHAVAAEEGVSKIFRRLYHNPDGYQRDGEYDFVTYFECGEENLPVYDRITSALRDEKQNPEWRYVTEGPEWRGRRALRW